MKKVLFLAAAVTTLFASCSKDATQDVATVQTGDAAFYASMSFEAAETTRHFINDENEYQWEAGDMVGVATNGTTVPFITIQGGVNAAFTSVGNDLDFLGDEPFYMAYPYGTKVEANTDATTGVTTVTGLKVPATQRFRANSFSTMTAPAFAYVEDFADGDQVEFQAAASMIEIPLIGKGAIKKLTLSAPNYALAGDIKAVMSENKDGESVVKFETVGTTKEITLEFGESQFNLDYYHSEDKAKVVFVVAPGKVTAAETMTLTATFAGENAGTATATFTVPANTEFAPNKLFALEPKTLGLDNCQLITNEVEFLAYLRQPYKYVSGQLVYNDGLVISDLDFDSFDAQAAYAELGAIANRTPAQDNQYRALRNYMNNEGAVVSFSNGAIIGGCSEPSVINGLVVLGNGISTGADLENIKFTNSAVIVEDYPAANVGFIAPTCNTATVEDVVIGAGNFVNALEANAEYFVGGIYGTYAAGTPIGVTVEELPQIVLRENGSTWAINKENVTIDGFMMAGQIFGSVYVGNTAEYAMSINLDDYKVASLDEMPAIFKVSANTGNVLNIEATEAAATIDNVIAVNGDTATTALASIVVNGVSYWNGTTYAPKGTKFFTAEELAYVLNAGNSANITLTHNIDMQCVDTEEESQVVTLTHYQSSAFNVNTTYTGTGDNKVYNVFEIKNLIGKTVDARVATLFGYTANVSNVTLSDVTIETGYNANYIAGLAHTGTAQNVVINDLTINVGKAHNEATTIGGVFGTAVYNSVKNVTVNSCAINYEGTAKSNVGIIAGTLTINPDATETLEGVKISSNKNDFSVSKNFGEWWTKGADLANFKSSASYAGRYPYGVVTVANAQFATAGNVKAYLAAKDCQSWSSRIAAGIVFSNTLTDAAAKVEFDVAKEYKYAFYLNDGLTIGNNNYSVFGFSKK